MSSFSSYSPLLRKKTIKIPSHPSHPSPPSRFMCLVCSTNPASYIYRPCCHKIACNTCASIVIRCLICDKNIREGNVCPVA